MVCIYVFEDDYAVYKVLCSCADCRNETVARELIRDKYPDLDVDKLSVKEVQTTDSKSIDDTVYVQIKLF